MFDGGYHSSIGAPDIPRPTLVPMLLEQRRSRSWSRLSTGVVVAVVIHALPFAGLLYWKISPPIVSREAPVLAVEMVRFQAPPEPPSDRPEGPRQVEAAASKPRPEEVRQHVTPDVAPSDVEPLPAPEPVPRQSPALASQPAPETTAPPSRPAPPADNATSASLSWQAQMMGHLERHKRYPASARGRQGTVYIRFTMNREGRVLSARVERSSGSGALDQAALDMMKRAQPLPKPPPEVPGNPLELTVPVEFFVRR